MSAEPRAGGTLTPAVWQRVRAGVGPDGGPVGAVAEQERGALGAHRVAETRTALASRVLGEPRVERSGAEHP